MNNPTKNNVTAILLAAGKGTRMKSRLPKVLHPLLGQPMVEYALQAVSQVSDAPPVIVVGHGADAVRQAVGKRGRFVLQAEQLGTGHAVMQTQSIAKGKSQWVVVTTADMPLMRGETLQKLVAAHQSHSGPITMLTVIADDPRGFGRIVRNADGQVGQIVEEAHATPEQCAIGELNASVYCFDSDWLWPHLSQIPLSPKGEYYLTDLVALAVQENQMVQALPMDDASEAIGVNTRVHLAEAERLLRERINRNWMLSGVTFQDPHTAYVEPTVIIGQDTVIAANTHLQGDTQIGEACQIGPNTTIRNCKLGNRVQVFSSVLEYAQVEDDVDIGPFGHLRKGAHLGQGVHMGNFGEVKNSYLGPGTKMGHFSYLGDATIEGDVNIGAGTITCNYDGQHKHPTQIGKGVFIGSDTMLVAPLEIGAGARTGAGAVVTKNVPPHTLVVGVPARAIRKLEQSE